MISFDTNILVYATAHWPDTKAARGRELIGRAMQSGWGVLLLQTLAEFSNVSLRKAGIPIEEIRAIIDAWRAVLPVHAAEEGTLRRRSTPCGCIAWVSGMRCSGLRPSAWACATC
jgi:predicted nucleic acid-binding protein